MRRIQLTYKFRLYPRKEQEEKLLETLELCRQTYNYFLAQWNGKPQSRLKLQAQLPKLKIEKPELSKVYSKALRMVLYQDASWGKFLYMLSYKAERAGSFVVKVNPK
ncbi:MAG: helix-turn-helix domain-containing protein [Candidatus Bathyarchaeia archaeon]